jgi:thioredoxin 1
MDLSPTGGRPARRRDDRAGREEPMAGTILELNSGNFKTTVESGSTPVLVDFWAPWCGPCRAIAPTMKDMAAEHGDRVKFVKLNVDESPATGARYSVLSIPTLILFDGGEPQQTVIGARSRSHYEQAWAGWLEAAA